ncbi:hypothetical protein ACOSP7_020370 [Xanthoceras sorbifolium]
MAAGLFKLIHGLSVQNNDHCPQWRRTFFAHLVSAGRFYPSKRSNYWLVVMVIMSYGSNPLTKHHAVLGMFNVDPEKYRYWIRVGALLGFIILFNVLITFSLVYT